MISNELKDANLIDMAEQFYGKPVMSNKWMFSNENVSLVNKDKAVINYLDFCKLLNSSWTWSQLKKNGTKPNLVY